jgi:hypothetical protein
LQALVWLAQFFQQLCKIKFMSQAFVKESDEQWLHEVGPNKASLIVYLTRENNGIRVYETKTSIQQGRELHHMSNGLVYAKDKHGLWEVMP